jgi:uncharacterized DUF497 family protein
LLRGHLPRAIVFRNYGKRLWRLHRACYKAMPFDFDPAKDAHNRAKHGMSLAEAEHFDFDTAIVMEDDSERYGEQRFRAIGQLRNSARIVVLIYTFRRGVPRPISIRAAEPKESRLWHAN